MNKSAIQRFAVWARTELIAGVSQRAYQYGITEDGYGEANAVTVGGRALSTEEQSQRKELVDQVRRNGYTQVMEEVAYTWFNRFIALRFMEVNNYLPTHIRVFSDSTGAFKPQILSDALHLELPGLKMDKVAAYIEKNQTEDLYRYLLLTQCNALNGALPQMFERMGSYTELLLPNNILKQDGILGRMVSDIPEEDWTEQVQIIGWLYQYYNSELKDETFALLKKNVKITKERIPSATQLFTPDWIVKYMVENSLGRLWIEHLRAPRSYFTLTLTSELYPSDPPYWSADGSKLKEQWKYYLDEAQQKPEVQKQLDALRGEYAGLRPQDIKVIDPCMGSGHILVYAFDVLMQIYESEGWSQRDAAQSILENNLYGLDIDPRAGPLPYFSVMMKARQYDRRFLSRGIQPNVYATAGDKEGEKFGSLLMVDAPGERPEDPQSIFDLQDYERRMNIWNYRHLLSQKYHVVVTNPPYMGASNMNGDLSEFVKKDYPDSKSDLSTCFMEKCAQLCDKDGYYAMINIPVWMFLSSYEKLRQKMLAQNTILTMVHPGRGIFGSDFGTTTFVIAKNHYKGYTGTYRRLFDQQGEVEGIEEREQAFLSGKGAFTARQDNFSKIPGSPVAYWVSERFIRTFEKKNIGQIAEARSGMSTTDNDRFLRHWYEVEIQNFCLSCKSLQQASESGLKWFPYNKGGEFRRWYGNNDLVVNWYNDGEEVKYWVTHNPSDPKTTSWGRRIFATDRFFQEGITWSSVTSGTFAGRYYGTGFIFDSGANGLFANDHGELIYLVGLLNSKFFNFALNIINPTINNGPGTISKVPAIIDKHRLPTVAELAGQNISLSRADWDSYETSWDFTRHPLVERRMAGAYAWGDNPPVCELSSVYKAWKLECDGRFDTLKANEEELNRIFIDIYGLQDELTPEVADKDVTVHCIYDTKEDVPESLKGSSYVRTRRDEIVSLISYAVGCMFGRYSLDVEGLAYAGGDFNSVYRKDRLVDEHGNAIIFGGISLALSKDYTYIKADGEWKELSFPVDADNIIPICDDDYFDDDITGRFVKWVETVYGRDTLEENLKFIADALGGKGTPREVIRGYFLNGFYADHLKTYQKRPIYWLFDSGKKNGFKALIYMHRYQSDLLARMRTDYVHEQQERYRTQLAHLAEAIDHAGASQRVKLTGQQKKLQEQALELQKYEEKIHHLADQNISIDLDDGVKVNYAKFEDVLAKIK